jgi:hypothetical protein
VLAVAIGAWWARRPQPSVSFFAAFAGLAFKKEFDVMLKAGDTES